MSQQGRWKYYLLGCGGHARSVADVILSNNPKAEVVFIDKGAAPGELIMGFSTVNVAPEDAVEFVPAIGDNVIRRKWCEGRKLVSVISNCAHIGKEANVGMGVFIANGVHIGPQATIGRGTIVNTGAIVEHNALIGDYCHIAPHATICGGVRIKGEVTIGAGAIVKPMVSIAANIVVGAGAIVVDSLDEEGIYVGCPARRLK